jgi:hypothetical protein
MTQAECARRVNVNVRTLRRWLSDIPDFAGLVRGEKESGHDLRAEDVLQDLLLSTDERVRLQAARELRRSVPIPAGAADADDDADLLDGWRS